MGTLTTATGGDRNIVHTADLFARFRAICGGCHIAASLGGKHIDDNVESFVATFDSGWLSYITSDDPELFMPPPPLGKPFSARDGDDPVVQLVRQLEPWLAAGRPAQMFMIGGSAGDAPQAASYTFTPESGVALTNLGTCIPAVDQVANSNSGEMESLDTFFATASALPTTLSETDLTTLDSRTLAATGVIAFVPTYPLYSDGSGKLRHVRVPRGESIRFDAQKQTFDIPANTRFYKTFMRKVIDRSGVESHRKIETRLIVARPDRVQADGSVEQTALFGTYKWSEDETSATLAHLPYRDGTPFSDEVRTYVTDELALQAVIDSIGPGAHFEADLAAALKTHPGIEQHYAIPGRIRCVQCHMGSPTNNFVLGFFPLQIARRPTGTGGTYEPTGDDELTQLQRLIDYGVITGAAPADVLTLEQSQGTRRPRTEAELAAQGYMLGNCSHCHNPIGFPSVTTPVLKTALDFMPSAVGGGIFEFPLERMSPVRARGANGDIPIPYITPSLRDYPVATDGLTRVDNGEPLEGDNARKTWSPKYETNTGRCESDNPVTRGYCGTRKTGPAVVPAPWRSLIYRNVDAPFPYFDDYVPFPHMPMNSPGFDCRAPRIMGDWMVGLPAVRKSPPRYVNGDPISEDTLPKEGATPGDGTYDSHPQPYAELSPKDSRYPAAQKKARERLDEYHDGVRYNYCEQILDGGIYDPVAPRPGAYRPDPDRYTFGAFQPVRDPRTPTDWLPTIGVPYHSHWFNYDPTDPPPPWSPRRPEWRKILGVDGPPQEDPSPPAGYTVVTEAEKASRRVVVEAISDSTLTAELRAFATTEVPFGLWQAKPECDIKLAAQPKVSDFVGSARRSWLNSLKTPPAGDARVYMLSPGAAIYRHVCINCHGPRADGRGLQADALAASSEGDARPANFRDGLFGPLTQVGGNLATFGADTQTATQWGARYMAWMTLGGTLKKIPGDIVHQVEATRILGEPRGNLHTLPGARDVSGNMLNLAKGLCSVVLPKPIPAGNFFQYTSFRASGLPVAYPPFNHKNAPFIPVNGDKQMWLELCTRFSPPVVRVYDLVGDEIQLGAFYYADAYPVSAPVLDHEQIVRRGIGPDNYYPACLKKPTSDDAAALADKPVRAVMHMPDCPDALLDTGKLMWSAGNIVEEYDDNVNRWELRGAIAAGMSVFSHLQSGGQEIPKPYYNECQLLQ